MSKRRHFLFPRALIFWLLCAPGLAFGCIWMDGTTLQGEPRGYEFSPKRMFQREIDQTPEEKLERVNWIRTRKKNESSKEESDAVRAMLAGNPQAAIALLVEVERKTPGIYSTAANLGTAYELAGDNENALKWITEGMARKTASHGGTEWLHQLILETKIRLAKDPNYLASRPIIPLPKKFGRETMIEVGGTKRSIADVVSAIYLQMRERLLFVKPPDPIVADLFFTYAMIDAQTNVVESAIDLLELSKMYGFPDTVLLEQLMAKYKSIVPPPKKEDANKSRPAK